VACRYSSRPPSIPFKQSNLTKPAPNAGFSPFIRLFRDGEEADNINYPPDCAVIERMTDARMFRQILSPSM
jgi:hypothetical protein